MILQWLQGLGAFAGLMSALYLFWQHLTKRMPVAIIVPGKVYDLSPQKDQFIRIKNPADRPMILRFSDNLAQNELRIVHSDTTRGAIVRAMGLTVEVILEADAVRDFRLERRADHSDIDPDNHLQIRFGWRYAQPFRYQIERTCKVIIRKRDYDALAEDGAHISDDD